MRERLVALFYPIWFPFIYLHLLWTGNTISSICKRYCVSRKTYYKWRNRYNHRGIDGLSDLSRRPYNIKYNKKVTSELEETILDLIHQKIWNMDWLMVVCAMTLNLELKSCRSLVHCSFANAFYTKYSLKCILPVLKLNVFDWSSSSHFHHSTYPHNTIKDLSNYSGICDGIGAWESDHFSNVI